MYERWDDDKADDDLEDDDHGYGNLWKIIFDPSAHAYIMGDQHVVTFDQKHYSFAGRCSYILARDMADDRFTVVVNYNNRPRQPQVQSIVVLLRGVAIEVDIDSKVSVSQLCIMIIMMMIVKITMVMMMIIMIITITIVTMMITTTTTPTTTNFFFFF